MSPVKSELVNLALDLLKPWPDNPRPRARRSAADDAELLASVKTDGVLQSLVVRPDGKAGNGKGYLIVCGERRYHAAVAAGLSHVPATVRDLTDAQALAIALTENIQRRDMHPLDEADGIAELQKIDPALKTPAALAAKLGLPESHVRRRLKLRRLGKTARSAFLGDAITAQHAELLTGVTNPKDQDEALERGAFYEIFGAEVKNAIKSGDWAEVRDHMAPIAFLREWIRDHTVVDIRDETVQQEFPEVRELVASTPKASAATVLQLSEARYRSPAGTIPLDQWRVAKKKCAKTERGVVVHGGATVVREICRDKTCAIHWPELNRPKEPAATTASGRPAKPTAFERQQAARRQAELAWAKLKRAAWPAVVAAVKVYARVTGALVLEVLGGHGVKAVAERSGLKLTDDTAAAFLAIHAIERKAYSRGDFARATAPYRFDLARFDRDQKKLAKAKAASKPRTGSAAKGRSVKKGKARK